MHGSLPWPCPAPLRLGHTRRSSTPRPACCRDLLRMSSPAALGTMNSTHPLLIAEIHLIPLGGGASGASRAASPGIEAFPEAHRLRPLHLTLPPCPSRCLLARGPPGESGDTDGSVRGGCGSSSDPIPSKALLIPLRPEPCLLTARFSNDAGADGVDAPLDDPAEEQIDFMSPDSRPVAAEQIDPSTSKRARSGNAGGDGRPEPRTWSGQPFPRTALSRNA
jgi:hypothetical protein